MFVISNQKSTKQNDCVMQGTLFFSLKEHVYCDAALIMCVPCGKAS